MRGIWSKRAAVSSAMRRLVGKVVCNGHKVRPDVHDIEDAKAIAALLFCESFGARDSSEGR